MGAGAEGSGGFKASRARSTIFTRDTTVRSREHRTPQNSLMPAGHRHTAGRDIAAETGITATLHPSDIATRHLTPTQRAPLQTLSRDPTRQISKTDPPTYGNPYL